MNSLRLLDVPTDDTLSYKVYVSKAVPLADVTITANLDVLVSTRDKSEALDAKIHAALQDFIATNWDIVSQERHGATPGFERVSLRALAKVPVEQSRNLKERANKANRVGLEFGHLSVNRSLPQDLVGQIMKELWFEAVTKVNGHLDEFGRVSGRIWRIGNISLGVPGGRGRVRNEKGGFRDEVDDPLGDLMESGLSGVEKISLIAEVTLRSERPDPAVQAEA